MDGPATCCEPVTTSASLGSTNSWPGQPRNSTSSLCCFCGACSSAAAPVHLQERRIRADEEDEEAIAVAEQAVLTRRERERERERERAPETTASHDTAERGETTLGLGGEVRGATLLFGFAVAADGTLATFGLGPAAPTSGLCTGGRRAVTNNNDESLFVCCVVGLRTGAGCR